jgi:hypothetical protein
LKAQDNFQPGYCKRIIKIVEFQLGKETTSGLADDADILRRPYLNMTRFNNNEDYITKALHLTTAVGKLPKSVDDRDTKGDLLEDMKRNHYRSAFSHPELTTGKVELNKKNKCQPWRFTFGVVESVKHLHQEHADEEDNQVISLYHVQLKKFRVMSQVCVPMVDDLYDFTYKIWGKVRYFLPAVARAVPPNTSQILERD